MGYSIWGSYYNIPKAIFYLPKGLIVVRVLGLRENLEQFILSFRGLGFRV